MGEWNVFDNGEEPGIEHKLGAPIGTGEFCGCGHYFANHDELGCVRRNCYCKLSYAKLVADFQKKEKEHNDRS